MRKLSLSFVVFLCCNIAYPQTQYWGVANYGQTGGGEIFVTDENGQNPFTVHQFLENTGGSPYYNEMCECPNGKLYGLTRSGGIGHHGVLYEFNPVNGAYLVKHYFNDVSYGVQPYGGLICATNGKLYGMTNGGGLSNDGVLFEYDPGMNSYSVLISFEEYASGASPRGTLMQASNGMIYGVTEYGGLFGDGTLFEYNPMTGVFSKRIDFNDATDGRYPVGSLIEVLPGVLYGVTYLGGIGGGIIYKYETGTGLLQQQCSFTNVRGEHPCQGLVKASNGLIYGACYSGGANGIGTIFSFDPVSQTYDSIISCSWGACYPSSKLIQATNGKLYGTTLCPDEGTFYELDIADTTFSVLHHFFGGYDGGNPYGPLIQSSNGKLYGSTNLGGMGNSGIVYEYDLTQPYYAKKVDFASTINGASPDGGLVLANNGKLYGLTTQGGSSFSWVIHGCGVLYEIDPQTAVFTKKIDLDTSIGCYGWGTMINASNGNLFGVTAEGGIYDHGVLFEYNPVTNTYLVRHHFLGDTNGGAPRVRLVEATNGKLYGTTCCDGNFNGGVLFEFDPVTGIYSIKHHFIHPDGSSPCGGGLVEAPNGKLYGLACEGGLNWDGVIFEFDPLTGAYTNKFDFLDTVSGSCVMGSLILAQNNKLYGVAHCGGQYGLGVLFEFDPANGIFAKRIEFKDSTTGTYPLNRLLEASNGFLYGLTSSDEVFEFDPIIGTINITAVFQCDMLADCAFDHLIEVNSEVGLNERSFRKTIIYPNPSDGLVRVSTSGTIRRLRVYNTLGVLVFEEANPCAGECVIDMSQLPNGVYLLIAQEEDQVQSFKLILDR